MFKYVVFLFGIYDVLDFNRDIEIELFSEEFFMVSFRWCV